MPTDPCDDALRELYGFLDGALTVERRSLIRTHIDQCSSCLEIYDFEAELRQVVAQRCRDEVPESLRLRVLEVIRAEIVVEVRPEGGEGSDRSTGPG